MPELAPPVAGPPASWPFFFCFSVWRSAFFKGRHNPARCRCYDAQRAFFNGYSTVFQGNWVLDRCGGSRNISPHPGPARRTTLQHVHFAKCELLNLHCVPIENIWPQCGPADSALRQRYFRQKDVVENYLTAQVKAGNIDLAEAQKQIARDWT